MISKEVETSFSKKKCLASEKAAATKKKTVFVDLERVNGDLRGNGLAPWSSALLSGLANCLFMWFIITACLSCTAQGNSSPLFLPSAVSCLPEKGDDTFAVRNCKWRCTYYRTTATVHTCVVCSCMWPEVSFHVPLAQICVLVK